MKSEILNCMTEEQSQQIFTAVKAAANNDWDTANVCVGNMDKGTLEILVALLNASREERRAKHEMV